MMRLLRLLPPLVACLSAAAVAQDLPSETDWRWVQPHIDSALATGRSGIAIRTELSQDLLLLLTPGRGVSRATGALCSNCTDPCRSFTIDLEYRGGERVAQFEGRACAISGNFQNWTLDAPPQRVRLLVAKPPGPDPALASAARGLLAALGYGTLGASDEALAEALEEFRRDAGIGTPGRPLDEADVAALRDTYVRSQDARGACPGAASARFVACGRLAN